MTGGTKRESGYVDISPNTIEHLLYAFTGGAGKFMERSYRLGKTLIKDNMEPMLWRDTPVARQFISEPSPYTVLFKMKDMYEESGRVYYDEIQTQQFKLYLRLAKENGMLSRKDRDKYSKQFKDNQKKIKRARK